MTLPLCHFAKWRGTVGKVLRCLKIFKRTCVTAGAPLPSRPSAKPGIGGGPKKRGHQAQWGIAAPLRQLRELAERVEFPEKNATVCQFRASFGGGGAEGVKFPEKNAGSLPASPRGSDTFSKMTVLGQGVGQSEWRAGGCVCAPAQCNNAIMQSIKRFCSMGLGKIQGCALKGAIQEPSADGRPS